MHKVGILGFGKVGQLRAKILSDLGQEIVAVYDPGLKTKTEYPCVDNPEEIFANKEIDVVFVCTPNNFNKEYVIKGLNANKHVFCEKPPALNADEVKLVMQAEGKTKKKLMYGFNHRHHPSIVKAKELIDSKAYGNVLWMRGRYGKSVDDRFFDNWRANAKMSGGGILIDQGIHMLDLFLYFGKEFDDIHAFVSNTYWKDLNIEDNVFAIFKNSKTGVTASLHSTMTQWRHLFSFEIFLEKGYLVVNGLKTPSGTYGEEVLTIAKNRSQAPAATWESEEHFSFPIDTSWEKETKYFLTAIDKDKRISIGTSKDALSLMKIIDKIYAPKKEGKKNYGF